MKRIKFYSLIAIFGLLFSGCKKYDDAIDTINSRLDNIEGVQINSLQAQINTINQSIPEMEEVDKELKDYIVTLQSSALSFQDKIEATNSKIAELDSAFNTSIAEIEASNDAFKTELLSQINTSKADILSQLESVKTELLSELSQIDSTIITLQAKDSALVLKITELKEYVVDGLSDIEEWAEATFVTLEHYNRLATEITTIKEGMISLNESITSLEKRLTEDINNEIKKSIESIKEETLSSIVLDITKSYTDAIQNAKNEITAAYTEAIDDAIKNLENSMLEWINNKLSGYYTIAQADAKLVSLKQELESQLESQKAYLENIISSLSTELNNKISANKALINTLREDVSSAQEEIKLNKLLISNNSETISKNAASILINSQSIAQNKSDLSTNKDLINKNKNLINKNVILLESTQNTILVLQQAVDSNTKTIAENAKAIAQNASLIATNATAIDNNAQAISENATAIFQLRSNLEATSAKITEDYKKAIKEAIETNNGIISKAIADAINEVNYRIDTEISSINDKITTLTSRVTALESELKNIKQAINTIQANIANIQNQIAAIMSQIQSVEYIPQYSDGCATMYYNSLSGAITPGTATLDFEIRPASVVADLVSVWEDALSVKAAYAQTRAVDFIELEITFASYEDCILSIEISGEPLNLDFYRGDMTANIRLEISDGNNQLTSEYIKLRPWSTDKLYIPDDSFKNYLLANFDTDNDGAISMDEAAAVTEINVSNSSPKISTLSGIEYFTNISRLDCSYNEINKLNLTYNVNLESLNVSGNNLEYFDLSKCTKLQDLNCSDNKLSTLNLSSLIDLEQLYCGGNELLTLNTHSNRALTILDCQQNQLTKLDLRGNNALVVLDCGENSLTSLSVETPNLSSLNCDNNHLSILPTSSLLGLTIIDCSYNQLTDLETFPCKNLNSLNCAYNNIKILNVSKNAQLTNLNCSNNPNLTEIWMKDIIQQAAVNTIKDENTSINIHNGGIHIPDDNLRNYLLTNYDDDNDEVISTDEAENITLVNCSGKMIEDLTGLRSCPNLRTLDCSDNNIKNIDLSELNQLQTLRIYDNPVEFININNCTSLQYFYVLNATTNAFATASAITLNGYNLSPSLTLFTEGLNRPTLYLKSSTALKNLDISHSETETFYADDCSALENIAYPVELNYLSLDHCTSIHLDIALLTSLEKLYARNCNLTEVNISKNTNLQTIDFAYNNLERINITSNTKLTYLDLSNNKLNAINVRNNTNLLHLDIENNAAISIVDLHYNTALEILLASGLSITDINLTNNTNLKAVSLCNKNLTSIIGKSSIAGLGIVFQEKTQYQKGRMISARQAYTTWSKARDWCINYGSGWYFPEVSEFSINSTLVTELNNVLEACGYAEITTNLPYWTNNYAGRRVYGGAWHNLYEVLYIGSSKTTESGDDNNNYARAFFDY